MARLPLVKIGIVGLGSDWQESVRPAIANMQSRIRVVAVYDDVALAARQAAQAFAAEPVLGIRTLLLRNDVDALLLRSAGWQRDWLLDLLRERGSPVQLGPDVPLTDAQLDEFHRASIEDGTIVIPELRLRYMPATLRLRELQATTLGRILRLVVHPPTWNLPFADSPPLVHLLDWCQALVERAPESIERMPSRPAAGLDQGVRIAFGPLQAAGGDRSIEVLIPFSLENSSPVSVETARPLCQLHCERGSAVIRSATELAWTSNGQSHTEVLSSDRSASEVVLDHFARRVRGGLIPTPDLSDLRRARDLAAVVERISQS